MGLERRPFTIKLDADNAAWLAELQNSCLPLEVSKSSLVNSLVTIARTQIQVTPASVQITPRNLSVNDIGVPGGQALLTREGSVCQELPNSTGAEPRRAVSSSGSISGSLSDQHPGNGGQSNTGPLAIEAAPIPLPKKLRRAERAS